MTEQQIDKYIEDIGYSLGNLHTFNSPHDFRVTITELSHAVVALLKDRQTQRLDKTERSVQQARSDGYREGYQFGLSVGMKKGRRQGIKEFMVALEKGSDD